MENKKDTPVDLTETSKTHLVCRDLMHAWEWTTDLVPHRVDRKIVEVTRVLACLRCETTREDTYKVPTFERLKSRYVYPDGYLVHQGGHVPKTTVRAEVFKRMQKGAWS
jgi:hypothetical protein